MQTGFSMENQPLGTFLTYELQPGEKLDSLAMGMLKNNQIPGMLPVSSTYEKGIQRVRFQISSMTPLKEYWNGMVNQVKAVAFLKSLSGTTLECQEYMLDISQLVLDRDYIFVDPRTQEAGLAYLPVLGQAVEKASIEQFLRELMLGVRFEPGGNANDIMRLINTVNTPNFSIRDFYHQLQGGVTSAPAAGGAVVRRVQEVKRVGKAPQRVASAGETLLLRHLRTGKQAQISKSPYHVGRERRVVDFWLEGGHDWVGTDHAYFVQREGCFYLVDNASLNHTWLNGRQLEPREEYEVKAGDKIRMADEEFELLHG